MKSSSRLGISGSPAKKCEEMDGEMTELSEDTVVPFSKMRKLIADRLTRSKQTIPHFYLSVDIDMSEALVVRASFNAENETRISVTDMLVKAVANALSQYRRMNCHVSDDSLVMKKNINIGIAVSIEDGLLVPVIPDADRKDLTEIASISRKKISDAKRGVIDPRVVGTFTITNLGMFGVSEFLPIIKPPECAILAAGSTGKKPVVKNDQLCIRDMMVLSLACDHRAVDGAYAGQFLNHIKDILENPRALYREK